MTSLLRQQVNGLIQVNSDMWAPHASDTVLPRFTDRWGQVNDHVSRVKADGWVPLFKD